MRHKAELARVHASSLSPSPFPARGHRLSGLALLSFPSRLAHGRGNARHAQPRRNLRDDTPVGRKIWPGFRRRDRNAARRLKRELLKKTARAPRVMIADKLGSHGAARKDMGPKVEHRQHKWLNNRAENSHRPTRRRERIMKRFKSSRQARRLLLIHDQCANLFHPPRPEHQTAQETAQARRAHRAAAITAWREISRMSQTA